MGNERLLLGTIGFWGFFGIIFCCWGGFRTPWVGRPRRGFRKYLTHNSSRASRGSLHGGASLKVLEVPKRHPPKGTLGIYFLVTRPKYPPYRETGVAMPLLHCDSCGIADCRCYTPTSSRTSCPIAIKRQALERAASQKKLASEAYRAIGGVARNSTANRPVEGH